MTSSPSTAALNTLLAIEYRSLPRYIAQSGPWVRADQQYAIEILNRIAKTQFQQGKRIADLLYSRDQNPDFSDFPSEFARFHDLSLVYLLEPLLKWQRWAIEHAGECVQRLSHDAEAYTLAEEVLGGEKAHLELLEETAARLHGRGAGAQSSSADPATPS